MDSVRKIISGWSWVERIAYPGIALFFLIALWSSLFRDFDHDEFEALHSAWLSFSGQTIYVDFFQHHHFLLYYSLAPVFAIFGEGVDAIVAARLLSLVMMLGIIFLTYRIAGLVYDRSVAILAVFFLMTAFTFFDKAIEVRPDVPLVLMELLSVFFLFTSFRAGRSWRLVASAVALFVGFLFLQKAVFLGILIGMLFLYKIWRRELGWREFLVYWGLFSVLISGFAWYVSVTFSWSEYFFLNWELNTKLLNTFPLYKYFLRSVAQNPLLWGLFLSGIVIMIRRRTFDSVAFFAIGLLGFIFTTKSPFPQYYLMSLPFVAIVSAVFFEKLRKRRVGIAFSLMALSVAWSLGTVLYMWKGNDAQFAKVEYVLSMTSQDDLVYDGDAQFNVFRKDVDYFWYSLKPKTGNLIAYRLARDYEYDPYRLFDEKKPKIVSSSFIKTKNPAVADHYTKSESFGDLYIRNGE